MRSDFSKAYLSAVNYLPDRLWRAAFSLGADQRARCEEIRIRAGRPPKALVDGRYLSLTYKGEMVIAATDDLNEIINRATERSVHTYSGQINNGFVTTAEGHRIGLTGDCSVRDGNVSTVRSISCVNIRIAKPYTGLADHICEQLYKDGFNDTLVVSPPGGGKTTLLRDMSRMLSGRLSVSIVDERYEIAGSRGENRSFDIGDCDVMSGMSKCAAIERLIRSMSPHIIALDEITQQSDVETICRTAYCGCAFLATAHASSIDELDKRPI